jgi:hypothetical protein
MVAGVNVLACGILLTLWIVNILVEVCVICLVKALEYNVGVEIVHILLIYFFHEFTWPRLNNTYVVDSSTANLDDLSVHQ